jgi:hypothetical protein
MTHIFNNEEGITFGIKARNAKATEKEGQGICHVDFPVGV